MADPFPTTNPSSDNTGLSRRSLIASAAVASIAGKSTPTHPDAALLELGRKASALETTIDNRKEDYEDLIDERDEIAERIFKMRATTHAGFMVKARRMMWYRGGNFDHELEHPEDITFAVSLLRDLLAID
jgi:hypothetical protein